MTVRVREKILRQLLFELVQIRTSRLAYLYGSSSSFAPQPVSRAAHAQREEERAGRSSREKRKGRPNETLDDKKLVNRLASTR